MSANPTFVGIRRFFYLALAGSILLFAYGYLTKGTLPGVDQVDEALFLEPVQEATVRAPFELTYAGNSYHVVPRAEYRLQGLVVTHNNITGFSDIYHDSGSVDTKDICVVYGTNARSGVYLNSEFWSGAWTCYYRTDLGFLFSNSHISNNHLITDRDALRRQIADIRIGDQVVVEGLLVDYNPINQPRNVRGTSLTRDDTGNGACEVLFVENIEVLKKGTPLAYAATRFGAYGFVLSLVGMLAALAIEAHTTPRHQYSSRWGEYKGY
ncbi:hypothetical protein [Acanthopleuribacter pedis]|uniref:Transmembrane protein n=1 Tax=Acanthopleuribacter pedis TaxID=442870 RepID=A0A8J7U654_9BACT|nr:hypothetical protein [Acanthopleuribacter pedis]MBO1321539.1 hypothetical protein [Acanthopleuribacter pedis]